MRSYAFTTLALIVVLMLVPCSQAAPAPEYPDSTDGLRMLLHDVIAAEKKGDGQGVSAFLKEMEIPNYEQWFTKNYGKEKGESWAGPYGKDLGENEAQMQQVFSRLAQEDGEIETRKVNDMPEPGRGLEWGMLHSSKRPVEIYFAGWRKASDPNDAKLEKIGYFLFIDGKFRWDSLIKFVAVHVVTEADVPPAQDSPLQAVDPASLDADGKPFRPGKDGVGYPSCVYCPSPAYTDAARAAKFQGTVLLQVVIGADGRASNIKVLNTPGYGLDATAAEAVMNWRFKPAIGPNGRPVATITTIEVNLRSLK